jgi:biopolymer transport protein ExbD
MKSILPPDEEVGFQMAPMIDCVFLLIIFFMSAANQRQAEKIEIEVPEAAAAVVAKEQIGRGSITITNEGDIYIGVNKVTEEEVADQVALGVRENPDLRIFLRADKRVAYREVRRVMDQVAAAGVGDIIFATYEESP